MTSILRQGSLCAARALVGARRLAVGGIGILLAACEPDRPIPDPKSKCRVEGDWNFIRNAIRVDHYKPNDCPKLVLRAEYPHGGYFTPYEANEIAPHASVEAGTLVLTAIANHHGEEKERVESFMRLWHDAYVRAYITGYFMRASVPLCNLCRFEDHAFHLLFARDNEIAQAEVHMPYYDAWLADIGGPNWCPNPTYQCPTFPSGTGFTLTANVINGFNGPYLYEWFRNGVSMGPPSSASTIADYGDQGGTFQNYRVAITDTLRARVVSEEKAVWIPYPQGGGGGCEPWMIECE